MDNIIPVDKYFLETKKKITNVDFGYHVEIIYQDGFSV